MAQTYSKLFDHLVWSTKRRHPFISAAIQQRLYLYIGAVLHNQDICLVQIGGMPDHIHLLTLSKPHKRIGSEVIRRVKSESSKWVQKEFAEAKDFAWQDGYGIFSVSHSQAEIVKKYIENQQEHHKTRSFEDEYRILLEKQEITYDARFIYG